jgi:transcription elongation factor GreA
MSDKIPMTREGYEKLRKELEHLKTAKRRQIAEEIARARAFGDLKENAEYHAAKNHQALNEKKIAEIEEKFSRIQIIDDAKIPKGQIFIGATVLLKDLKTQEELNYTLVTQDEADFDEGKISITSPIAKGLLGLKVGDTADIPIPAGTLKYKILKISHHGKH